MDFHRHFESRRGEMLQMLKKFVHLESPTGDKKAVDLCAAAVVQEFRREGARVTVHPQKEIGDLQVLEIAPPGLALPDEPVLVLGHADTVWPVGKIAKMPFYLQGDKVFGPGVLDMKGGLVMAAFAIGTMRRLNLKPRRKVVLLLNSAEETGHKAADELIRKLARKSEFVLCLEPALPGGALKLERKGRIVVRLEARGRAAHAGAPDKGVNAIEELAVQIGRLKKLKSKETTLNVGLVGGGEAVNVVPESAWAVVDIRFWTTRGKDGAWNAIRGLAPSLRGAKLRPSLESVTPPLERTKASLALFEEAKKIAADLGLALKGGRTGGASDASTAAGVGIPALDGLGPDGDGLHAEHEHLLLSSLVSRTALLTELLLRL